MLLALLAITLTRLNERSAILFYEGSTTRSATRPNEGSATRLNEGFVITLKLELERNHNLLIRLRLVHARFPNDFGHLFFLSQNKHQLIVKLWVVIIHNGGAMWVHFIPTVELCLLLCWVFALKIEELEHISNRALLVSMGNKCGFLVCVGDCVWLW